MSEGVKFATKVASGIGRFAAGEPLGTTTYTFEPAVAGTVALAPALPMAGPLLPNAELSCLVTKRLSFMAILPPVARASSVEKVSSCNALLVRARSFSTPTVS